MIIYVHIYIHIYTHTCLPSQIHRLRQPDPQTNDPHDNDVPFPLPRAKTQWLRKTIIHISALGPLDAHSRVRTLASIH